MPERLDKQPLPTRSAALERLDQFSPLAGTEYQKWRNYDCGKNRHDRVSGLSPYIRIGLLDEADLFPHATKGYFNFKKHLPSIWARIDANRQRDLNL